MCETCEQIEAVEVAAAETFYSMVVSADDRCREVVSTYLAGRPSKSTARRFSQQLDRLLGKRHHRAIGDWCQAWERAEVGRVILGSLSDVELMIFTSAFRAVTLSEVEQLRGEYYRELGVERELSEALAERFLAFRQFLATRQRIQGLVQAVVQIIRPKSTALMN